MEINTDMLFLAESDKEVSELILSTTNDEIKQNIAAYHTQQSIEKLIKYLLITARGFSSIEHNIYKLIQDAEKENIEIPDWVKEGDYEISSWATTIRYNANFKTDRDRVKEYNKQITLWIKALKENL